MSGAFADSAYLRWVTGESDPERAWEGYFARTQPQVRAVLDGLLASVPPEDRAGAVQLAGEVEAFCLPSGAVESRVFESPGPAAGHLIGISPLVIQLSAEIAYGLHMAHPYVPEALPAGWESATMHAQESFALNIFQFVRMLERPGETPVPSTMLTTAHEGIDPAESSLSLNNPRSFHDAAMIFALAHELAHLRAGHLPSGEGQSAGSLLIDQRFASPMGISDQENEELAADASTFTACFNYLLTTWLWSEEFREGTGQSRKRQTDERHRHLMAWKSAIRATEMCEAYYSAVLLLAHLTLRGGDEDTARRLQTTGMRLPYVQAVVQEVRQNALVPGYGPFMWTERDVAHRKAYHSWRLHLMENLLPETSRHRPTHLPGLADRYLTPAETWQDPAGAAAALPVLEEQLATMRRELGSGHQNTLATRASVVMVRFAAGGDASAAMAELQVVIADMTRALGGGDPSTFAARHNLAQVRRKSGDRMGATAAFAALLLEESRVLGPDHPEVLDTRYELAHLRGEGGDAAGAVAAFTSLLADQERLLGHDHVLTELTRGSLAQWRRETANPPQEATAVPGGPLIAHPPVFSPDHPDTLPAYEARLAYLERSLGHGHPDTLTTRWFLATLRAKAGDASGTAAAYDGLLEHDLHVMDFDDVDIGVLRANLEYWRSLESG
ncbi:GTP-binding protein [Streptomyces sp. CMB-StM0423]|uniref:GTP-binding protein n=1 Tax=Streptomyces sp. CMB-StM0423 TaxID=2059884 RepID=UPI001F252D97|nr:GTP-binding protein [Streptomyces sp. CMB-StM0423]